MHFKKMGPTVIHAKAMEKLEKKEKKLNPQILDRKN